MSKAEVNINKLVKQRGPTFYVTVKVKGVRWFSFKLKLAALLIKMGAWISGGVVIVETDKEG